MNIYQESKENDLQEKSKILKDYSNFNECYVKFILSYLSRYAYTRTDSEKRFLFFFRLYVIHILFLKKCGLPEDTIDMHL